MNLVVLGSGTANPHPDRSSAGFWIETSAGLIMLDFSASALHRLAQERLDWANIDTIWVSHFHLDHCGGLPPYLFSTRHAPETSRREKPLRLVGGVGLRNLVHSFNETGKGKLLEQKFPVEIIEVEPLEKFEILSGVEAMALPTPHTDESLAIRMEDDGKVLVYTSDTGLNKQIAEFSKRVDLLIIESSFVKEKKTDVHLELAEAMYLVNRARPRRAMLTHFYAEWDRVDFSAEIGALGPVCEMIEATDGLRLKI